MLVAYGCDVACVRAASALGSTAPLLDRVGIRPVRRVAPGPVASKGGSGFRLLDSRSRATRDARERGGDVRDTRSTARKRIGRAREPGQDGGATLGRDEPSAPHRVLSTREGCRGSAAATGDPLRHRPTRAVLAGNATPAVTLVCQFCSSRIGPWSVVQTVLVLPLRSNGLTEHGHRSDADAADVRGHLGRDADVDVFEDGDVANCHVDEAILILGHGRRRRDAHHEQGGCAQRCEEPLERGPQEPPGDRGNTTRRIYLSEARTHMTVNETCMSRQEMRKIIERCRRHLTPHRASRYRSALRRQSSRRRPACS